jgi:tetratricopeptide (TPR) repeat protein
MDLGRVHKDRAAAFLLNGKLPAALEEFKKAVALDPQDLLARRKVAEVFARMGRIEDAIAAYQGLAGRYAVAGHLLEAIAVGKVILQLDPHHQQTQQALAQFAERREQREGWHARLPTTMTALIEQERLREVPAPAPLTPSVDVEMTGGLAEPFPELPRELMVELLQRLSLRYNICYSSGHGAAARIGIAEIGWEARRGREAEDARARRTSRGQCSPWPFALPSGSTQDGSWHPRRVESQASNPDPEEVLARCYACPMARGAVDERSPQLSPQLLATRVVDPPLEKRSNRP